MPRQIFLFSPIFEYSAQGVIEKLLELDRESNEEITMFINSPGGSVNAMFAIIDIMKVIKSPIRTIVTGMAASAASIIASSGNTRLMTENARFMIHEVWSFVGGTVSEMDDNLKEITKEQEKLINILSKNTGKTPDQIKNTIKKADKYFDAKESKRFGLVDSIIKEKSAQVLKLSEPMNGEGFEINVNEEGHSRVQLLRTGCFSHAVFGDFEITKEMLQEMKKNFDNNIRGIDISIDYTHENENGESPAACWIKHLNIESLDEGYALIAEAEFTPKGREKVLSKEFKYSSADFVMDYVDESGEHVPYVLRGGTLTNRPFIKDMEPIKLSEKQKTKKEKKLMTKEELMNMLKEQHGVNVAELENSISSLQAEISDLQNKIKELNALPAQKDEEISNLKEKLLNLTNEMNQKEKEAMFNSLVEEGKVLPAQKEKVLNKFDTAEEIKEWFSDAPQVVKTKAKGSDDTANIGLTEAEQALVDSGELTREEILNNRKLK